MPCSSALSVPRRQGYEPTRHSCYPCLCPLPRSLVGTKGRKAQPWELGLSGKAVHTCPASCSVQTARPPRTASPTAGSSGSSSSTSSPSSRPWLSTFGITCTVRLEVRIHRCLEMTNSGQWCGDGAIMCSREGSRRLTMPSLVSSLQCTPSLPSWNTLLS